METKTATTTTRNHSDSWNMHKAQEIMSEK